MNEQAMTSYRGLMQEVKYRTEAIDKVLASSIPLRAVIAEELCYLQLRMICESIAIGCLLIHGDVSAKKTDLLRSYKADWIMNGLEKLHPDFYPTPLEQDDLPAEAPGGAVTWVHRTSGFLTKRELLDLYTRHAGERLHRGSVRNLAKRDRPNFGAIQAWRDKAVRLLTRHIITSPDREHIFYCVMNNGQDQVASNLFAHRP
ncbi:hypothetical protein [Phenylobacterium sp. NIBR 498073]|uniref:hypothetical protein n=1 Tax=Phenylobacterium sp. NIBR 498073 TaxID=3015177 RepID=UPI0022B3478B|nr:hypothetical protein [Phenylobacterium sp. NIBR 498073]WGU42091.1 hypothetical protein O4N75_10260 [Phenylobacterium sp. NIBR 498073]